MVVEAGRALVAEDRQALEAGLGDALTEEVDLGVVIDDDAAIRQATEAGAALRIDGNPPSRKVELIELISWVHSLETPKKSGRGPCC